MIIKEIKINNILGIKIAEYTPHPDETTIVVAGNNGQGKSSFLEAIWIACLGKKKDQKVIHDGASEGTIELTLDNDMIITRSFKNDKTAITVKQGTNTVQRPQEFLNSLIKGITLDPVKFISLPEKEQAKILIEISGVNVSEYENNYRSLFEQRTEVNRDLKKSEAQLAGCEQRKPVEFINVVELTEKLNSAMQYNQQYDDAVKNIEEKKRQKEEAEARIVQIEKEKTELMQKLSDLGDDIANLEFTSPTKKIDVTEITAKMQESEEINKKARAYESYLELIKIVEDYRKDSEQLTDKMKHMTGMLYDKVAEKQIMNGVSVDLENGITINDIPLKQASTSEKLIFATKLAAIQNPEFKVMFVQDGNVLDENNLELLKKYAELSGFQLWLEMVGSQGSVVIEEGEVKSC